MSSSKRFWRRSEQLPAGWGIAGTTGYDFMNLVNGLFVDPRAERAFDAIYRRFAGISGSFEQFAYRAKKDIMRTALASELEVLTTMLDEIAGTDRRSNDYTYNVLRDALTEAVASFPVYRTYVTSEAVEPSDRRYIELALAAARKRSELGDEHVFNFLEDVLTMRLPAESPNYDRRAVLRFAMKFQQYTSPVMAKAVEDTAFYRYVRLVSLNEVGGDPRRFGTSVAAFHDANIERADKFPHAMLATATHDHKRGEDTRTRIDALSEMPDVWDQALGRWSALNADHKTDLDGNPAPTDNDEYFLYQILLGTWPAQWLDDGATIDPTELERYVTRIESYQRKAMREAKFRTSWTNPNVAYEDASLAFTRTALSAHPPTPFLRALRALARECARIGAVSSLAQIALKMTAPGVPDIYQGCEFWDLSLVDPDNRRPVDYVARRDALSAMRTSLEHDPRALATELLDGWPDGRVKAYVTWRLMTLRRARAATFASAPYTPLQTEGACGDHLVAYTRGDLVVIVPRLVRRLLDGNEGLVLSWTGESIRLPARAASRYIDCFTGTVVAPRHDSNGKHLDVGALLTSFPVAVLEPASAT